MNNLSLLLKSYGPVEAGVSGKEFYLSARGHKVMGQDLATLAVALFYKIAEAKQDEAIKRYKGN